MLHTDRGHQVPLASFTGTPYWSGTDFLSNITPQRSDLNRGAWLRLETKVRDLAKRPGVKAVYVMTEPLYERSMKPLPGADEAHIVPSGYWKIVAVRDQGTIRVAAFYLDQRLARGADFCKHVKTIDEIERRSRLDLFADLDDTREAKLEAGPATLGPWLGCNVQP